MQFRACMHDAMYGHGRRHISRMQCRPAEQTKAPVHTHTRPHAHVHTHTHTHTHPLHSMGTRAHACTNTRPRVCTQTHRHRAPRMAPKSQSACLSYSESSLVLRSNTPLLLSGTCHASTSCTPSPPKLGPLVLVILLVPPPPPPPAPMFPKLPIPHPSRNPWSNPPAASPPAPKSTCSRPLDWECLVFGARHVFRIEGLELGFPGNVLCLGRGTTCFYACMQAPQLRCCNASIKLGSLTCIHASTSPMRTHARTSVALAISSASSSVSLRLRGTPTSLFSLSPFPLKSTVFVCPDSESPCIYQRLFGRGRIACMHGQTCISP